MNKKAKDDEERSHADSFVGYLHKHGFSESGGGEYFTVYCKTHMPDVYVFDLSDAYHGPEASHWVASWFEDQPFVAGGFTVQSLKGFLKSYFTVNKED